MRPWPAPKSPADEWRIHFHIPLHSPPAAWFENTYGPSACGSWMFSKAIRILCSHLEMETYTWEVMPPELKSRSVVDQLSAEYDWCLSALKGRGLA